MPSVPFEVIPKPLKRITSSMFSKRREAKLPAAEEEEDMMSIPHQEVPLHVDVVYERDWYHQCYLPGKTKEWCYEGFKTDFPGNKDWQFPAAREDELVDDDEDLAPDQCSKPQAAIIDEGNYSPKTPVPICNGVESPHFDSPDPSPLTTTVTNSRNTPTDSVLKGADTPPNRISPIATSSTQKSLRSSTSSPRKTKLVCDFSKTIDPDDVAPEEDLHSFAATPEIRERMGPAHARGVLAQIERRNMPKGKRVRQNLQRRTLNLINECHEQGIAWGVLRSVRTWLNARAEKKEKIKKGEKLLVPSLLVTCPQGLGVFPQCRQDVMGGEKTRA